MGARFVVYGLLGWVAEIVWTAVSEKWKGAGGWRLQGWTYLWMFPIYGLCAPLFEPVHDRIRYLPMALRGGVWVTGFFAVEYAAGWALRRLTGRCPWDYTGARFHLHGLIRWDYAPLWFCFGLFMEQVHDRLVLLTPALRAALAA